MNSKIVNRVLSGLFILTISACAVNCGKNHPPKLRDNSDRKLPVFLKDKSTASACIDGKKAFLHIKNIVAFGPRHAGTEALEQTRVYIETQLKNMGLHPVRHKFTAHTPHPEIRDVKLANISVDIGDVKNSDRFIILSGHFDGKIIDKGEFLGANDGGSSTGLLLEMAGCLKKYPVKLPVKILFFDGEEALVKWTDSDSLYGSKNFAAELAEQGLVKKVAALINIDMVADPNLRFMIDTQSSSKLMESLKDAADKLGYSDLFEGRGGVIGDDHVPFVEMGIPSVEIIDFHFGPGWSSNAYWHTSNDNLSHISAESMTKTGQIVLLSLQ